MLRKITNAFAFLVLAAVSLAIFANSMTKPIGRDEQMYCTGAVLLAQGKMIYRDFSYVSQMPYHPLLCAALFKALNTTHYLLTVRILSSLCDILIAVCIVGIYRHIFKSFAISGMLFGLAGAVLCVFNPLVDYANGFAWNHDVVILCVVLSYWLFVSTDFKRKSKYWRIAAIGALLTFATCMRITTVLVHLLFFVMLLSQFAESIKQRFKTISPFLIATALLLIWPVWTITLAPRAFFINLFRIPRLNSALLYKIGMAHNKFHLTLSSITMPGYILLIIIAIYLCVTVVRQRHKLSTPEKRNLLLALLLPITFFIIAFIPPTMWSQYLAAPVPFIATSLALPLLHLKKLAGDKHFKIAAVLLATCVFGAVVSLPVVVRRVPKLFYPQSWVPIGLHRISERIGEKTKSPKLILTLAPLFALEGGCNIYTEFSAGPFAYRIADYLSPSDRDITRTAGPETLGALLEESPPSAVILGLEFEFLEEPLFQTAVQPNREKWERKTYDTHPIVYFRR